MPDFYSARLVGHRGMMAVYPENTLGGFEAAIAAGAKLIECDIQLTRDLVPVVLHDRCLSRTTEQEVDRTIFDLTVAQAQGVSVHYPQRFGNEFKPQPIATLMQLLTLVKQHPEVKIMVELKQESIDRFGLEQVIAATFACFAECREQVIVISFNDEAIKQALAEGYVGGWVVETLDEASRALALALQPGYLIGDVTLVDIAQVQLWQAPEGHRWQWMLYDVVDPELIKSLFAQGVDLIETADIAGVLDALSHSDAQSDPS